MASFIQFGRPSKARTLPRKTWCGAVFAFLLTVAAGVSFAQGRGNQDTGSAVSEFRGNGAEITVTVKDGSGEPISSTAIVKVFRDGTIPAGQGPTSRGHAIFVVNLLG